MKSLRVISLLPAATEMVAALGCADQVVGRSHGCDFPESIKTLPVCSKPRFNGSAPGADIHENVERLLARALSIFEIDASLIRDLQPDLILTQSQCEVCAVSDHDLERTLADWTGRRPRILSLAPLRLADVFQNVVQIAHALGVPDRANELVTEWRGRLDKLRANAYSLVTKPTVVCVEWFEPLMVAGNWVPELVEIAGGRDILGKAGVHSPWIEWRDVRKADPDFIVLMPCGFNVERTISEAQVLGSLPGWRDLRAVKAGRVFAVDGNSHFNRPGPRLIDSAEILAKIFGEKLDELSHASVQSVGLSKDGDLLTGRALEHRSVLKSDS
ncbi:ABC transporter substrate-binding protein [bacterium]|nr:ABC transporter substrate-binding protein [bacterium]